MKFLEDFAWKFIKMRDVCTKAKEIIKQDKNFQPEDMETSDLLNSHTENLKILPKIEAKVVEQQIPFPSISQPSSNFADFSIDPFAETYELVNVLQSFTSYKFLDQKKKLRFQHDFRKLIMNFEEEFLK